MKHCVFDLDGVIVDAMAVHREAFLDAANTVVPGCVSLDEHEASLAGLSTRQKLVELVSRRAVSEDAVELIWKEKQRITRARVPESPLTVPWIPSLLDDLRAGGRKIALCTNSIVSTAMSVLTAHGLHSRFDAVVGSDDVAAGKPAPDPYLLACDRLGAAPGECVAFEDSPYGVRSAKAAGCLTYLVVEPRECLDAKRVRRWLQLADLV